MNTKGHGDVAETAGIPLLESALGKDKRSLHAFHLGNWLTDVSQAVDPVAYTAGSGKAKEAISKAVNSLKETIDGMIDQALSTIFESVPNPILKGTVLKALKPDLEPHAKRAIDALQGRIDFFFEMRTNERDARLFEFYRSAFLLVGYFKFVHPTAPGQAPRMDFGNFMRVFGKLTDTRGATGKRPADDRPGAYTQYFPHEHLDRPELLPPQVPPVFSPGRQSLGQTFQVEPGKRSGPRSPRSPAAGRPGQADLYSYLRDFMEMTAGLLAEVDLEFQQAFRKGVKDEDPEWHVTLAKLGHALHQVEDFFAHSNFIELAAKRLGPEFMGKALPRTGSLEFFNRSSTIFYKRLKRHLTEELDDWRRHPDEDWVVTGFFDIQDTLISLLHIGEEVFGFDVPDPLAEGHELLEDVKTRAQEPNIALFEIREAIRHTLDFLTDPKAALDDRDNDIAQKLKKKFKPDADNLLRPEVTEQVAREVARELVILDKAPPEVHQEFLNVIIRGARMYTFGKLSHSVYKTLKEISDFLKNPIGWLTRFLTEELRKKLEDAVKFYAKELVYDWFGAGRIGCHSLMAKDNGRETLFLYQKECATAVHWYIVNTLLRWSRPDAKDAKLLDWLHLLEFFLKNPLAPGTMRFQSVRINIPVNIFHATLAGEQLLAGNPGLSLEHIFRPTAFDPKRFTWRTIADANFGTSLLPLKQAQKVINQILRDKAWGFPVTPPNFAFKPGVRIVIPEQKRQVVLKVSIGEDPSWFKPVMDRKDWKVFKGFVDPATGAQVPPLKHHVPVPVSKEELMKIIRRGKALRRLAREAYRPEQKP